MSYSKSHDTNRSPLNKYVLAIGESEWIENTNNGTSFAFPLEIRTDGRRDATQSARRGLLCQCVQQQHAVTPTSADQFCNEDQRMRADYTVRVLPGEQELASRGLTGHTHSPFQQIHWRRRPSVTASRHRHRHRHRNK